jgi:hypothetical protein
MLAFESKQHAAEGLHEYTTQITAKELLAEFPNFHPKM